ncbi:MAG TPA: hypothetical protein VIY49_03965 [Bryobacteraceae bacterium]
MNAKSVCARRVLSAKDLEIRPDRDLTEIVARFLAVGEGVLAHWVEYARGLLLFVTAPGDDRSGEFYVYDRKKGSFWLLTLADAVFGGYPVSQMWQKIREFRLLGFAENPARLAAARQPANSL